MNIGFLNSSVPDDFKRRIYFVGGDIVWDIKDATLAERHKLILDEINKSKRVILSFCDFKAKDVVLDEMNRILLLCNLKEEIVVKAYLG